MKTVRWWDKAQSESIDVQPFGVSQTQRVPVDLPALGQGSWHFGQGRRPAADEEAALRLGFDLGLRLVDTAEMYGDGRSEKLIGRAIAGRRDSLFLVSKVYPHNAGRRAMTASCDASLTRLGVDRLDLYLLHWRANADLDEAVETFEALKAAGKIGAWGVSNFDVDDMEDLFRVPGGERCAMNQVLYNVSSRGIEFDLMPWCEAHDVPIMAYSPLGSGSDLLHDAALAEVAGRHAATPAAVALAWAIRSGRVIAIPEAGDAAHMRTNAVAVTLRLDEDDLAILDSAFPPPMRKVPLDLL